MKKYLSFILILYVTSLYAQQTENVLYSPHNVSVLPHTGELQYGITLFHLQDPDFDWNVNLTYTSDGFRPLVYSGIVGQNWSLGIGGSISREIIDIPDDYILYNGLSDEMGFLVRLDTNLTGGPQDFGSDIYTFSVNGHYGTFTIGQDKQALHQSGEVVYADFSGTTKQRVSLMDANELLSELKRPYPSEIRITTMDGYRYIFGGDIDALEYTYTYAQENFGVPYLPKPAPVISSWHISKIIAPNGREIHFHYQPHVLNQYNYMENGVGAYRPTAQSSLQFSSTYTSSLLPIEDRDVHQEENPNAWFVIAEQSISKNTLLDSVTTSDGSFAIKMVYINDSNYVFTNTQHYRAYTMPQELDIKCPKPFLNIIALHADNQIVKAWLLNYQSVRLGECRTPRKYLRRCKTFSNTGYNFTYNFANDTAITHVDTLAYMDVYGYRNTAEHYKFGTLIQARDMLGGITSVEYERTVFDSTRIPYERGKSLIRKLNAPQVHNVRVKQVDITDAIGHVYLRKTYSYDDAFAIARGTRNSSTNFTELFNPREETFILPQSYGILNMDYALLRDTTHHFVKKYDVKGYLRTQPSNRPVIEYTEVNELVQKENDNLFTQNHYYYGTVQDSIGHLTSMTEMPYLYALRSEYNLRAQPIRVTRFDGNNRLVHQSDYTYTPQILLAQRTEQHYETNGTYQQVNSYSYDSLRRVVREQTTVGNQSRFTAYTYPDDMFRTDSTCTGFIERGLREMTFRKKINEPLEIVNGVVRNNTDYVTAALLNLPKRYDYKKPAPDVPIIPDSTIHYGPRSQSDIIPEEWDSYTAPYAALQLQITEPIQDFSSVHKTGGTLVADNRYDTITIFKYDGWLRPIRIMPLGGMETQYQWDNLHLHIVKESQGSKAVSYTWLPYVGMKSQTDVRGITTYYNYDINGNMVEVYRINGDKKEVLQFYEYHYPKLQ